MKFDCVLFDLDGTLLDTSGGVLQAIDYTIQKMELPDLAEDVKRTFIGPPIYESLKIAYDLNQEDCDKATEIFRNAYKDIFLFQAVPYDGIYGLLLNLRKAGYKLAVATNKRDDYAQRLLEYFDFPKYFDYILGSDAANTMKKSDIIRVCLKELKCKDNDRAIIVGDTIHDLKGARNVGIHFAGVNYGFGFKSEKDYEMLETEPVFSDLADLGRYLIWEEN